MQAAACMYNILIFNTCCGANALHAAADSNDRRLRRRGSEGLRAGLCRCCMLALHEEVRLHACRLGELCWFVVQICNAVSSSYVLASGLRGNGNVN